MMWRNTRTAYGLVSRLLHWTVALLFIAQIPLGFLTQATAQNPALQFDLYQWHKSTGFLILALAILRILWSLTSRKPKEPSGTKPTMQCAAHMAHAALLTMTLAIPLTGWAIASTSPLQIPSFFFDLVVIPNLPMAVSDSAEAIWSQLHAWLAYGAAALIVMHAGAAVFHAIRPEAGSLHGMLPQRSRR
ncbi:cytochrome B [Rhizobium rhizosphaerae]|uniref:Cytochrome B n=1 Tax=Xaviernesmea rhizosphaerae TaxID=1672749 RepID=A0A1Q9ANR4_9HYPH|nr:cytochrome b [Xaviernesmea rhizosphaerae]OLP57064.1 cytochrome B [Xaviernesmea rhizosphaerae]OQP87092.1 cytochrome b [Xaviernesmea rhizosphaerae]